MSCLCFKGNGGAVRNAPPADTSHANSRANAASAASYNRRKPEFRTFSPVGGAPDPSLVCSNYDVIAAADTLDGGGASRCRGANSPRYATSPKPNKHKQAVDKNMRNHQTNTMNKINDLNRDDHSTNTYIKGYNVDPDDVGYSISEFMLSNAKEDVV